MNPLGALIIWFWKSIVAFLVNSVKKKNFRVEEHWRSPRVGKVVSFRVWILNETDPLVVENIVNGISVDIQQRGNVIHPIKEIITPEKEGQLLTSIEYKFSVRIAGDYRISILYENRHIEDSPMKIEFLPEVSVDHSQSTFLRASPLISSCIGVAQDFEIEPKDRFGNKCRLQDVQFSDFEFHPRVVSQIYITLIMY